MKVSLVVAAGAHEGKVIPLSGPQFLIGRDAQCHLRPASQAISKVHCAVIVRDGKVYIKDFGSTNGTLVNEQVIQNAEVAVEAGATLRVGPLDFRLQIEKPVAKGDGTPLPGGSAEAAALAAVKAATAGAPKAPPRDTTPNPAKVSGTTAAPGARPAAAKASGAVPAPKPTKPGEKPADAAKPGTSEAAALTSETVSEDDHDRIAAMLLGMDDDGNGSVPDGSTVMDIPSPLAEGATAAAAEQTKAGEKKDGAPKKAQTREEMTSAANDLLRQYMRRPK
jgi:predicted component of type VI protein secretion system